MCIRDRYNRNRPNDDLIPEAIAANLNLDIYATSESPWDLMATGGNFMSDGMGTAFSSELIIEENSGGNAWNGQQYPNHSQDEINTILNEFMGIERYVLMEVLPWDEIHHIDFTEPYDPGLRLGILRAVDQVTGDYPDLVVAREGVYGCTQGPRLETAAEIRRLFRDGCTIVGMTAMPEAALAREMGMPYAGISVTVNPGPGLAPGEVVLEDIEAAMDQGLAWVKAILLEFMAAAA